MKPLIIVNPAANSGRARSCLPPLYIALDRHGLEAQVRVSKTPDDPAAWAAEAAADGRTVVACGGDGLFHEIVNATQGDTTLGLIPQGSGNDFARSTGIPLDLDDAVAVLAKGNTRTLDLARLSGDEGDRLYACIASVGFDSVANEFANRVPILSGSALYTFAALVTLLRWRSAKFHLALDGDDSAPVDTSAWFVSAGNTSSYGGGMQVCPDADPTDGVLDVTMLGDVTRIGFLKVFGKLFDGTFTRQPPVRSWRTERLRISADRPLPVYADGERFGTLPVTVEAVPGAITLLAPV